MDPKECMLMVDGWMRNMEAHLRQIRMAVSVLYDHAKFEPDTKIVMPDAGKNESLRYSEIFRG